MPTPEQPPRGLPNWLKILSAVFLLICLAAAVIYVMGISATRRWEQLVRRLHEKGQPVTLREIEARRPVISDEGNMSLFLQSLEEDHEVFPGIGEVPPEVFVFGKQSPSFSDTLRRDHVEISREYLAKHRVVLDDLEPLLRLQNGRHPLDLSQPALMIPLPSLKPLRALTKLAILATIISLIDGMPDDATHYILLHLRIADSMDGEPNLISRLVQIAIDALAARAIEDCLRFSEPDKDSLAQLAEAVDRRLARARIQPAILGERAVFVDTCASLLDGRINMSSLGFGSAGPNSAWLTALPNLPVWLVRENQIKGTEILTWLVDAGDDFNSLQAAAAKLDIETPKLSGKYAVVKIMTPSLSFAVELHIKAMAELWTARTAIAAEQFRIDHGRFPHSLEELVPGYLEQVPVDPFDGFPLRLKTTEEGIVIYSIDENMFDEGGDVTTTPENNRPPDLGVRLVHPELRTITIVDPPLQEE